jgi:hypothetical protein
MRHFGKVCQPGANSQEEANDEGTVWKAKFERVSHEITQSYSQSVTDKNGGPVEQGLSALQVVVPAPFMCAPLNYQHPIMKTRMLRRTPMLRGYPHPNVRPITSGIQVPAMRLLAITSQKRGGSSSSHRADTRG